MAVFRFSALSDGQSLAFNPTTDVLNFDQTTVAAADLRVTQVGTNIRIDVVSGTQAGKDVTLQNVSPLQLATANVTFADGSKLGASQLVATLQGHPTLAATDISVI